MNTLLYIAMGMAAIWFTFRFVWFVRKRVLRRRERRPGRARCPSCGSKRLDDYSDDDSGMCLTCNHVWGVGAPGGPNT
jgi:hypothetical protein